MGDLPDIEDEGESGGSESGGGEPSGVIPAPTAETAAPAPLGCLSCGAPIVGVFCVGCGQKQDDLRRSMFMLARNFVEDTFAFDSRMWRTLGLLAAAPGLVPRDYAHGKRSRYTPPVRLFLVVSFLFFLTIGLTNTLFVGLQINFKDVAREDAEAAAVAFDGLVDADTASACSFGGELKFFVKEKDLNNNIERLEKCFGEISGRVGEELDEAAAATTDEVTKAEVGEAGQAVERVFGGVSWAVMNPRDFNNAVNDWLPRVMFLMTPVLALILALFLRRRTFVFDHMVMALYVHAVGFALVGASLILGQFGAPQVGPAAALALGVYYIAALKRAYERGWVKTVWTALASGLLYIVVLMAILVAIVSRIVWTSG